MAEEVRTWGAARPMRRQWTAAIMPATNGRCGSEGRAIGVRCARLVAEGPLNNRRAVLEGPEVVLQRVAALPRLLPRKTLEQPLRVQPHQLPYQVVSSLHLLDARRRAISASLRAGGWGRDYDRREGGG